MQERSNLQESQRQTWNGSKARQAGELSLEGVLSQLQDLRSLLPRTTLRTNLVPRLVQQLGPSLLLDGVIAERGLVWTQEHLRKQAQAPQEPAQASQEQAQELRERPAAVAPHGLPLPAPAGSLRASKPEAQDQQPSIPGAQPPSDGQEALLRPAAAKELPGARKRQQVQRPRPQPLLKRPRRSPGPVRNLQSDMEVAVEQQEQEPLKQQEAAPSVMHSDLQDEATPSCMKS